MHYGSKMKHKLLRRTTRAIKPINMEHGSPIPMSPPVQSTNPFIYQPSLKDLVDIWEVYTLVTSRRSHWNGRRVSGFMIGFPYTPPLSDIYGNDRATIPSTINMACTRLHMLEARTTTQYQYLYCLCHIKLLECSPVIAKSVFGSRIVM